MNKRKWGTNFRNEPLKIAMLYQNSNCLLFYGYSDLDEEYLIDDYINDHRSVFSKAEFDKLHVEIKTFNSLNEKRNFQNKFGIYEITTLFGSSIAVTQYELELYSHDIHEWYTMYKDVVVISQFLPDIMVPSGTMMKLSKIGSDMYGKVDNFLSFTELLSTNYIKSSLLQHPVTAMKMYDEEKSIRAGFEYQLFKDDE